MKRFTKGALAAVLATMFVGAGSQAQQSGDEAIEEITVLGIRASQQRALDLKRNSEVVVDAIAFEDIGKFPDQNIAEALQRIPGVAITRERGEGAQVSVRGFGPDFNVVTFNNRVTASVVNSRSFDFQILPSELIAGAQVFKSVDASMIEGSIGGGINIATLRPLNINQDRLISASVGGRYTDLGGDSDLRASGVFGGKFANDTVGLILGFAYDERSSRIDTAGAEGFWVRDISSGGVVVDRVRVDRARNYRLALEDRERTTVTAGLQIQPSDKLDINVDFLYSQFEVDTDEFGQQHVLFFGNTDNLVVSGNNTALSFTKPPGDVRPDLIRFDEYRDTETQMIGFNADFDATEKLTVEFDVAYSKATSDADPSSLQNSFAVIRATTPGVGMEYDISGGGIPTMDLNVDLNDLDYRPFFTTFSASDLEDTATDVKLKALWSVDNGIMSSVEAGVQYVDRSKLESQFSTPNGCAYCGPSIIIPTGSFQPFPVSDLLGGGSGFQNQWPVLDNQEFIRLVTEDDAVRAAGLLPVLRPGRGTDIDEETLSLFVQANLNGDWGDKEWSGNIGIRYVDTDLVTRGETTELVDIRKLNNDPLDGNIVIDTIDQDLGSISNDYSEVLPSVNFRLSITDDTLLRFAAAKVIARPNLGDLSTANSFEGNGAFFSSSGGNPFLDPYKAWQYDVGLEFYPTPDSAYSVNVFYKDIETFISTIGTLVPTEFSLTLPDPIGLVDPVVFSDTRVQNTPGGSVKGFELSALYSFTNLPAPFDGLGVQFNYTYADSDSKEVPSVQEFAAPSPTQLVGFAENAFNAIVFYEKGKVSTRLAYNWVDDYLTQRQVAIGQLPLYFESYGQLDFSFAYNITENLSFNFEGINITDENTLTYQDYRERVKDIEFTGRRFLVGIRGRW